MGSCAPLNPPLRDADATSICSASLQAYDLGQWALARRVLEMGLRCNPRHLLMLQRLAEVLVLLGDWGPARDVLNRLLEQVGCSRQLLCLLSETALWPASHLLSCTLLGQGKL